MSYDPYREKVNKYAPSTGYDTPSAPNGEYVQPAVVVQPNSVDPNALTKKPRPMNRWGDGICDWPKNLFPSCWCACCFCYGMYLNAQIAEKLGIGKFNVIIGVFLLIWLFSILLSAGLEGNPVVIYLPMICSFIYALYLRMAIVKKEGITESNSFVECCIGFWCWYCSVAQMGRHVYGYEKVLDGDSDPHRPDNYVAGPMDV